MKSAKSRSIIALAIAGTFACAGAFAGGVHHSTEVQTPSSVSESAPWLTGQSHLAGWTMQSLDPTAGFQQGQFSDGPYRTGMSSSMSGTGSGGYDSSGYDSSRRDAATRDGQVAIVEYWLIGEPSAFQGTGTSSGMGGSRSVGFDSSASDSDAMDLSMSRMDMFDTAMSESGLDSMDNSIDTGAGGYAYDSGAGTDGPLSIVYTPSAERIADSIGEATPLLSEHYLVAQPLSDFDPGNLIVLELGPAPEDVALLQALSRDFYVLTPVYDEG